MSIVWDRKKLDQLHSCLMKIILEVDRICEKNGITYFLGGGTLLGAVREGKLLPWDDDADLMMKREDYDKFCVLAEYELRTDFFIQNHKTDPHSHRPYVRVRLNNTVMATEFSSHFPSSHQGIFVDIFCHDKTANGKLAQKLHVIETVVINSLVFRKWESMAIPKIKKGWKSIISALFPIKILEKWQDSIYKRYFGKKDHCYLYDGMGKHLKRGAFPEKWLESSVKIPLDGNLLPVPCGYDEYLHWLYGDYHRIPDKADQTPAANIVKLDFGKWNLLTEEDHEQ
ncbi:MAG: LicD family protein [Clostridium sp.]|nr:LicD family protein [Clostridium sp.]MCM1547040.1 LicD family protein [Ruminococcus sp.]